MPSPKTPADVAPRRVAHVVDVFVRRSEAWLYDVVALPTGWTSTVLCESREHADEFPFALVEPKLPPPHRLMGEWWTRQLNRRLRLPIGPWNGWRRYLRRVPLEADVVHAHFGMAGWRVIDAGVAPVVTSFYGFDATDHGLLRYWGRRYYDLFSRGALFVAEGPAMARRIERLGAPPGRVRILPLIASTDDLTWRPPIFRDRIRVVMAGRFVEKKGFGDGIAAFADAFRADEAELALIGSGPLEDELRALVDRLGIGDRATFLPFQARDEYRRLLASCDIMLQPSRVARDGDSEGGAPTSLFDAQAVGLVVVVSDHADIPFVTNSNAAYVFREGNVPGAVAALRMARDSRDEWADRTRVGREHVERQHAREAVALRLRSIYAEAAAR